MRRKIESAEEYSLKRQSQTQKQEADLIREKIAADTQDKAEDRRIEEEDSIRDSETKLEVARMQQDSKEKQSNEQEKL